MDFALTNDLIIGGTMFAHKIIHKYSWNFPDRRMHNQIDHVLINRTVWYSLQVVRAFRGADVASDHAIMIARIALKLEATPKIRSKVNPNFGSSKLYIATVRNEFVIHSLTNLKSFS